MKLFHKVTATFRPKRMDDLAEGTEKWIGKSGVFTASWYIEEGKYAGQWAWQPPQGWDFAWCPTEDLEGPEVPRL